MPPLILVVCFDLLEWIKIIFTGADISIKYTPSLGIVDPKVGIRVFVTATIKLANAHLLEHLRGHKSRCFSLLLTDERN